jgi:hypothetical protein
VLLVERRIMFDLRGAERGTAVDKEVDGAEDTPACGPIQSRRRGKACSARE